jgi:COMPASS component SWD2
MITHGLQMDDNLGIGIDAGGGSQDGMRAELTKDAAKSLAVARVVRTHSKPVAALDFHHTGELLASSGTDDNLSFVDTLSGEVKKTLALKKYGCGAVRFIHNRASAPTLLIASAALTAETSGGAPGAAANHSVRALEVASSNYARYYAGHTARVVGLAPSPADPGVFLSGSVDASARLWDARRRDAVGVITLRTGRPPAVAFDPKGLVFGAAFLDGAQMLVKLYDARLYSEGPFVEFEIDAGITDPSEFAFSPDGEHFLIASAETGEPVRVFDAYEGKPWRELVRPEGRNGGALSAGFSPDAKFVVAGCEDHGVCVWDVASSDVLLDKPDSHALPVGAAAWNPVFGMMATACQNVVFWLPTVVVG